MGSLWLGVLCKCYLRMQLLVLRPPTNVQIPAPLKRNLSNETWYRPVGLVSGTTTIRTFEDGALSPPERRRPVGPRT